MSDIIHLLPDSVANQIAAGEVIQRPASVLKELVENAIDAGASCIQIVIKDAGRTLIQIVDNGKGMSETDARLAFERHATSKIKEADDLFAIRTMGFRGEALASIAAIAQVELRSRKEENELGTFIEIAGSRIFRQESCMCDKGSSFLVKNLFFNVPARRRFLKSDNVEKRHLLNEFYRIVLVNPEIEFSFFDGEEELYRLAPSNIKQRIEQIFGSSKRKISQQLLTIETNTSLVKISGFIGRPEFAQKRAHQYFFVNGRYMRHPYFNKAISLAYSQLIPEDEAPAYFIYLEVDPQSIDINIHPTKTEIKFENEQAIWAILSAAVKESLGKFNIVPSIDFDRENAPEIPVQRSNAEISPPKVHFNPSYNPFSGGYKRPQTEWEELYKGFEGQKESEKHLSIFSKKANEDTDTTGVYFQLKNKYLITSVKSGMLIIDQRRAHIHILFNQFLKNIQEKKGFSQQLLFPETLELMTEDSLFFEQIKSELAYLGFEMEPATSSSTNQYEIKGIPAQIHSSSKIIPLLRDIIEKVKGATGDAQTVIHEQIALSLAKTAAIQVGHTLNQEEMKDLVEQLFACPTHNHTSEGKTIMAIWTMDEIMRKFE